MSGERAVIGIDPGVTGAIACLPGGATADIPTYTTVGHRREYDLRGCWELLRILLEVRPDALVVLEELQAIPRMSAVSLRHLGRGCGIWEMACVAAGAPLERVRPQRWQKALQVSAGPEGSLMKARELFPEANLARAKDHGRAAALLIAEYGRRFLA